MENPLAFKISSLVLDMVLVGSILAIDHPPKITNFSDLWYMTLVGLIVRGNISPPISRSTTDSAPDQMQPSLVSDLLKSTAPPPPGEKCSVCHKNEVSIPVQISCGHIFCRVCALTTFAQRTDCPNCSAIPVPQEELERSTKSGLDMAFELRVARLLLSGWALLTLMLALLVFSFDQLGGSGLAFYYGSAYAALYPGTRNVSRHCFPARWWCFPLVSLCTSICTVAATYHAAFEFMDREKVFWPWWQIPPMMFCMSNVLFVVTYMIVAWFGERDEMDKIFW